MNLLIPASVGELIDKITILEIKAKRIDDSAKLANVNKELEALMAVVADQQLGYPTGALAELGHQLASVNLQLWEIEDEIRACEAQNDFGQKFINLARSVYITNDKRAAVKKEINLLTGASIIEEKSYKDAD